MNNLTKLIKKQREEFDDKHVDISQDRTLWTFKKESSVGQVRYSNHSNTTALLEEVIKMVEGEKLWKNEDEDHDYVEAYNQAKQHTIQSLQQTITEMT